MRKGIIYRFHYKIDYSNSLLKLASNTGMTSTKFTQFLEHLEDKIFTITTHRMLPEIFQQKKFTLDEKKVLLIAFFFILLLILAFLTIITVLLLIITTLYFVSLLSIRYEGIIDTLLICMGTGFISIIGFYIYYKPHLW